MIKIFKKDEKMGKNLLNYLNNNIEKNKKK